MHQAALDWSDVLAKTEGLTRTELPDSAPDGRFWLACQEDKFSGHQGPAFQLFPREEGETKKEATRRVSVSGQRWDWLLICRVHIHDGRALHEAQQ